MRGTAESWDAYASSLHLQAVLLATRLCIPPPQPPVHYPRVSLFE